MSRAEMYETNEARIARLEAENEELRAENEELRADNACYDEMSGRLGETAKRNAELENALLHAEMKNAALEKALLESEKRIAALTAELGTHQQATETSVREQRMAAGRSSTKASNNGSTLWSTNRAPVNVPSTDDPKAFPELSSVVPRGRRR